jgi:hypothetical protein
LRVDPTPRKPPQCGPTLHSVHHRMRLAGRRVHFVTHTHTERETKVPSRPVTPLPHLLEILDSLLPLLKLDVGGATQEMEVVVGRTQRDGV